MKDPAVIEFCRSAVFNRLESSMEKKKERTVMNECCSCKGRRTIPGDCHTMCATPDASMTGSQHGIRNGWFYYPFNFDPIWKTAMCKNYVSKESEKSVVSEPVSVAGESK